MTDVTTGIHDLSLATAHYVLDQTTLARELGIDDAKLKDGLGQDAMSVPAADEDIVTMAATAARPIIDRHGADRVRTVLLATETGVDQSKSAGLYVHGLLGLPHTCRVVELKQACYSATAALQFATALIARDPEQHVLVVASDIAKYKRGSAAEPTQGAAALAMLVTADPAILRVEPSSGMHSEDIMDFWRPNYRAEAVVDGKFSIDAYQRAVVSAFADYRERGGRDLAEFAAFCYHQPFTKMAVKAHRHLLDHLGVTAGPADLHAAVNASTHYNRVLGNSYAASAYVGLASLLDHRDDLADQPIAIVSYGSGSVAEFLGATVVPGYRDHLRSVENAAAIDQRKTVDYTRYCELHDACTPPDGGHHPNPQETTAPFRLAAISQHKRLYEAVA
ncbi:Polyketide biosynthesis 3-hydroxy-3-methylglutaryl-ACP synthase PksG [Actinomadura rubteroloni]|uniref:Polyketide biosynthesis 3-hydroxy-3-methylglutaryl-ACP synthase PksG n=1 Tax=Actinomadura rubteroloni TaxID=1926885 RepID=A0A2P4UEU9_9ACTN|nr:hydroxymethylglutaryl-CoA synthase [Actinomadura rubteroloni]POM23590.1 Polyketide biosynthesis 3-hydroxy-3-methylglutaryl-ACP synthase PksG [Actinomadura rubteroloni]